MRKLTYEYVKECIQNSGYTLLSKEYINSYTKLKLKCLKGHTYEVNLRDFKQGNRCPICSINNKYLNYNFIKKYIESFDYKLLSVNYKNSKTKLKVQCPNTHIYYTTWRNFQQGKRCPKCFFESQKFNYIEVKTYIEKFDYILLSTKYKNSHTKLELMCNKMHKFKVDFMHFKLGRRCPVCNIKSKKLNYTNIKIEIERHNYKLLSANYEGSNKQLKVMCSLGHIYKTSWDNFKQGYRCKQCWEINRRSFYTKETLQKLENYRQFIKILTSQNFTKYYYKINPKKLKRDSSNYHLDHIYSVADGFKNNIPPKIISNPNNLQMLWWKDNIIKRDKSAQTKQELYIGYYKYELEK